MELAGLACAQTLAKVYGKDKYSRVLVCCGPGNQGVVRYFSNAFVCSIRRQVVTGSLPLDIWVGTNTKILTSNFSCIALSVGMFGYQPTIYMPKVCSTCHRRSSTYVLQPGSKDHYKVFGHLKYRPHPTHKLPTAPAKPMRQHEDTDPPSFK